MPPYFDASSILGRILDDQVKKCFAAYDEIMVREFKLLLPMRDAFLDCARLHMHSAQTSLDHFFGSVSDHNAPADVAKARVEYLQILVKFWTEIRTIVVSAADNSNISEELGVETNNGLALMRDAVADCAKNLHEIVVGVVSQHDVTTTGKSVQ